ncbi:hypothetical protein [Streptomonospora litoralis]|uniref:Uncharacterized protein n=1 Tax=Streptomonospora litoralis TaxID=2498135 RepID=A0A4P6Q5T5_9ACTN|nr:hypothetical protein [Streptomonospora litoralis]QBI56106.1 hypothetical protein EKD16_21760 [Streptomonospora litoralis]
MVLADRTRRGIPALARCRSVGRTLRRVGVLTGLAAAGWLLGGAAAVADDLPVPDPAPIAEAVSASASASASASVDEGETGAGIGGAVPGEAGRAAEAASAPAAGALGRVGRQGQAAVQSGVPALASATGAEGVADAAGAGAREVVETTARGTGEVVTGTVDTGRKVGGFADESLDDSRLAGAVSDRLAGGTDRIQDHLEQTIDEGPQAGLDGVAAALDPPRPDTGEGAPDLRGDRDSAERESTDGSAAEPAARTQRAPVADEAVAAAAAAAAGTAAQAHSADSADTGEPLAGTAWHENSDSTGTVSSSPVPAAPAGFLMSRGHTLRLVAQRVALPADPAVVVRYTADDPSFSPD